MSDDYRAKGRLPPKDIEHVLFMLDKRQGHRIDEYIAERMTQIERALIVKERRYGRKRDYILVGPLTVGTTTPK